MFNEFKLNSAILRFKEKMRCKMCKHERADLPLYECRSSQQTVYKCIKCGSYYIFNYGLGVGYWIPDFPQSLVDIDKNN